MFHIELEFTYFLRCFFKLPRQGNSFLHFSQFLALCLFLNCLLRFQGAANSSSHVSHWKHSTKYLKPENSQDYCNKWPTPHRMVDRSPPPQEYIRNHLHKISLESTSTRYNQSPPPRDKIRFPHHKIRSESTTTRLDRNPPPQERIRVHLHKISLESTSTRLD